MGISLYSKVDVSNEKLKNIINILLYCYRHINDVILSFIKISDEIEFKDQHMINSEIRLIAILGSLGLDLQMIECIDKISQLASDNFRSHELIYIDSMKSSKALSKQTMTCIYILLNIIHCLSNLLSEPCWYKLFQSLQRLDMIKAQREQKTNTLDIALISSKIISDLEKIEVKDLQSDNSKGSSEKKYSFTLELERDLAQQHNTNLLEQIKAKSYNFTENEKDPDEIEILCSTLDSVFLNSYKLNV